MRISCGQALERQLAGDYPVCTSSRHCAENKEMTGDWASETNIDDGMIEKVQATLTVDMIMTPRKELSCCRPTDNMEKIISSNTNGYSAFPVVDEHDCIIGIFRADESTEALGEAGITVCSKMESLSEKLLIGAKDRILDYLQDSASRPIQLVVSDRRIVGLVTPADLQQLPVRVMLFSLITSLEISMAELIHNRWPSGYTCWHKFISCSRRKRILDKMNKSKKSDQFSKDILYAEISDKRDIIGKGLLLGKRRTRTNLKKYFEPIIDLRDNLSHANDYANTADKAAQLPYTIQAIIQIKKEISESTKEIDRKPSGEIP